MSTSYRRGVTVPKELRGLVLALHVIGLQLFLTSIVAQAIYVAGKITLRVMQ